MLLAKGVLNRWTPFQQECRRKVFNFSLFVINVLHHLFRASHKVEDLSASEAFVIIMKEWRRQDFNYSLIIASVRSCLEPF